VVSTDEPWRDEKMEVELLGGPADGMVVQVPMESALLPQRKILIKYAVPATLSFRGFPEHETEESALYHRHLRMIKTKTTLPWLYRWQPVGQ